MRTLGIYNPNAVALQTQHICGERLLGILFLLQYFDSSLENQKATWVSAFASLRINLYGPHCDHSNQDAQKWGNEISETFSVDFGNKLIFSWIAELGEYKLIFVGCQLGTAKHEPA